MLAQAALSTQTSPSKWSPKLVKLQSRDSQALWGSHPQAGMLRRFCGILLSAWRIGGDSGSLMGRSLEVGAQLTNALLAFTGNHGRWRRHRSSPDGYQQVIVKTLPKHCVMPSRGREARVTCAMKPSSGRGETAHSETLLLSCFYDVRTFRFLMYYRTSPRLRQTVAKDFFAGQDLVIFCISCSFLA